jgi:hypothetical protein
MQYMLFVRLENKGTQIACLDCYDKRFEKVEDNEYAESKFKMQLDYGSPILRLNNVQLCY